MPMCPTHNKEMKNKGKGFYCPTPIQKDEAGNVLAWCKYKLPSEGAPAGYESPVQRGFERGVQKAKEAVMTKEDWERKEERTNRNILLQVAFKAAVEWLAPRNAGTDEVNKLTLEWYSWLLSQMNYEKPATGQNSASQPVIHTPPADEPPLEAFNDPQ